MNACTQARAHGTPADGYRNRHPGSSPQPVWLNAGRRPIVAFLVQTRDSSFGDSERSFRGNSQIGVEGIG